LLLLIVFSLLFSADPVDYDELVGADALTDPLFSAMDTSQVTMEDANRILSLNDDDFGDTDTTRAGKKSNETTLPGYAWTPPPAQWLR
jgi:hypothetical protein